MLSAGAAPAAGVVRHRTEATFGADSDERLVDCDGLILAFTGHPRVWTTQGWNSDPVAIAKAFRATGADALRAVRGDFALAAWDTEKAQGLLAVDRIGVRQLVYARTRGGLAFASTLDMLLKHPDVPRELSDQAIFDYLYFHVCPAPQTIYRGLARIPPGHYVAFGSSTAPHPRPYWSMRFEEDASSDFESLRSRFIETVQAAVSIAASDAACGSFLSGGTDSSTVSGMLGRARGTPAKTFSIGFDAAGYDEMHYARIAASHFGCEHREYYVMPADVVATAPKIAAYYDQPFGNASAVPTYFCAKLAREHGVHRLLAGDGGDELFGGNERYARQWLLGLYHRLPKAVRSFLIEPLVLSTPLFRSVPGLRKVYSYVEQASMPMPNRYESRALLTHLGPENVLTPEFLAAINRDHPHQLMLEAHEPFAGCSLVNQMLGIDLRFTLADNDLPKVTRMCELAGVDVVFPLLDEDVVELSARLPADFKLRGTRLRWFFKEALRDFLPNEIIRKKKHGFGLPVGTWLTNHPPLLELASAAVDTLRVRGIVRASFVDDLRQRLLPAHPAYYGTMMWILMMLALWLDAKRR
jgi:asparagine synthase (glutamine-hydrolysing)